MLGSHEVLDCLLTEWNLQVKDTIIENSHFVLVLYSIYELALSARNSPMLSISQRVLGNTIVEANPIVFASSGISAFLSMLAVL